MNRSCSAVSMSCVGEATDYGYCRWPGGWLGDCVVVGCKMGLKVYSFFLGATKTDNFTFPDKHNGEIEKECGYLSLG